MAEPNSQHVYVDESGRPEVFGKDGHNLLTTGETPNHLVLAAVRTTNPSVLGDAVARAAPDPFKPRPLHAVDDSPGRRRIVCEALAKQDVVATAIVMDKRLLIPGGSWEQDRTQFYNAMLAYVLSDCLHLRARTVVTISHKDGDTEDDLQLIANEVHTRHEVILGRMVSFKRHEVVVRQRSGDDSRGLQAADYVAYAVHQAFERGNMRLMGILQPILGRVWDLGRLTSYTRKNPLKTPPSPKT